MGLINVLTPLLLFIDKTLPFRCHNVRNAFLEGNAVNNVHAMSGASPAPARSEQVQVVPKVVS